MEAVRYERFTMLIEGIRKSMSRLKEDAVPDLGIKSVHVMWLYKLRSYPEGLTSAELAAVSTVDRSLVSREITSLKRNGYIEATGNEGKRGYNARWHLTERGEEIAERIAKLVYRVQESVGDGIEQEELERFYVTLEKLHDNFRRLEFPSVNE